MAGEVDFIPHDNAPSCTILLVKQTGSFTILTGLGPMWLFMFLTLKISWESLILTHIQSNVKKILNGLLEEAIPSMIDTLKVMCVQKASTLGWPYSLKGQ